MSRAPKLYDGLTVREYSERTGLSEATLYKRIQKYGEPFPACLSAEPGRVRAERQQQADEKKLARDRRDLKLDISNVQRCARMEIFFNRASHKLHEQCVVGTKAMFTEQELQQAIEQHDRARKAVA
jgi:hypothetical protein